MTDAVRVLDDSDIKDLICAIRIERKPKNVRDRFAQDVRDAVAAYMQHKDFRSPIIQQRIRSIAESARLAIKGQAGAVERLIRRLQSLPPEARDHLEKRTPHDQVSEAREAVVKIQRPPTPLPSPKELRDPDRAPAALQDVYNRAVVCARLSETRNTRYPLRLGLYYGSCPWKWCRNRTASGAERVSSTLKLSGPGTASPCGVPSKRT